jgi:hypothetical protein
MVSTLGARKVSDSCAWRIFPGVPAEIPRVAADRTEVFLDGCPLKVGNASCADVPALLMMMVLVMILEGKLGGGFLLDFGEVGEQAFVGKIQRNRM